MHSIPKLLTALGLALALCVPMARAQATVVDDPDVDLTQFLKDPSHEARMLDLAYTKTGYLIAGFAELVPGPGDDRLVIVQRDLSGQWNLISNHAYGLEHILELSLTVPERGGGNDPVRHRVYVAIHFATDVGMPSELEALGVVSGPWLTKWKNPGRISFVPNVPQFPPRARERWTPVVAAVPYAPGDFTEHIVEVAFSWPVVPPILGASWTSVLRAQSFDYGKQMTNGAIIAGLGPTGSSAPELNGFDFRNPSICSDSKNGNTVIAVEDVSKDVVYVTAASPKVNHVDVMAATPGSFTGVGALLEGSPVVAADEGFVMFTYLGRDTSGRTGMYLASTTSTGGGYTALAQIHHWVDSPGDLAVREGSVYVAGRFFQDNVTPQKAVLQAWEGPWVNITGSNSYFTSVADHYHDNGQPRIAITDDGPVHQSVGYGARDWAGSQPAGGGIWVDL